MIFLPKMDFAGFIIRLGIWDEISTMLQHGVTNDRSITTVSPLSAGFSFLKGQRTPGNDKSDLKPAKGG